MGKRSPGQLDVPLVWEVGPPPPADPVDGESVFNEPPSYATSGRLLLAALADLGLVLLTLGMFWTLTVVLGADLGTRQALAAGLAGMEVVLLTFSGLLWGWRATPGMFLCGVAFTSQTALGRSFLLALIWILSLPLAGIPALLGRSGHRPLERLAGCPVRFR